MELLTNSLHHVVEDLGHLLVTLIGILALILEVPVTLRILPALEYKALAFSITLQRTCHSPFVEARRALGTQALCL